MSDKMIGTNEKGASPQIRGFLICGFGGSSEGIFVDLHGFRSIGAWCLMVFAALICGSPQGSLAHFLVSLEVRPINPFCVNRDFVFHGTIRISRPRNGDGSNRGHTIIGTLIPTPCKS